VVKQAEASSLLMVVLVVLMCYEVVRRYFFNAPTIWGFEATSFAYGLHFMLGLSYMERHSGHVRVDILVSRLSARTQAFMGLLTYLVIFIPVYSMMTVAAFKYAYISTVAHELNSTSWAPPIWPFKILMGLSFLFLLIQGLSTLLKHLRTLTGGQPA